MPVTVANLFRGFIVALMTVHVFYMYCLARTMGEPFGFSWQQLIIASLFALAMMIPLVWAVGIPELPELYVQSVRARKWFKAGRCSVCGYQIDHHASEHCSECGRLIEEPRPYRFGRGTIIQFAIMIVSAWLIGCTTGELWIDLDELVFRSEAMQAVARGATTYHVRSRRWPNDDLMLSYFDPTGFDDRDGFYCTRDAPVEINSRARIEESDEN